LIDFSPRDEYTNPTACPEIKTEDDSGDINLPRIFNYPPEKAKLKQALPIIPLKASASP
jgi:hypothetical protein